MKESLVTITEVPKSATDAAISIAVAEKFNVEFGDVRVVSRKLSALTVAVVYDGDKAPESISELASEFISYKNLVGN